MTEAPGICLEPIGYVRNAVKEWTDVVWEEIVSQVVLEER